MQDNVIEVLCNGDFTGRDICRKYFSTTDLEYLAQEIEKAAVRSSDLSEKR